MEKIYILSLSLAEGVGNKTAKKLLENFEKAENIFNSSAEELANLIGLKKAETLLKNKAILFEKAHKILDIANKGNISLVTLKDDLYPKNLKEIPDPPIVLYIKGNIHIPENCLSIVGSRKFSSYGKSITEKFAQEIAEENINVVSGMAAGIDSIAHWSVLKKQGFTTAVLGNGVDIIFPQENKKLYYEILEKGAIISEYPPGTKPTKYTFPQRNRIIAGLSYGTIITEASKKSGALITAKLANDYGRLVFSVPANINNPYAEGNNFLLKEGAIPLTSLEDIKENLSFLFHKTSSQEKNIELSDIEKKILNFLVEPRHIDTLIQELNMSFDEISLLLFNMEAKGIIEEQSGFYIRK
ncbi:MAG: DNA-protecting protein DprA [Aquificae bacterium]|nr:DNA-protecting protein DprA [Aquificota bacterium]